MVIGSRFVYLAIWKMWEYPSGRYWDNDAGDDSDDCPGVLLTIPDSRRRYDRRCDFGYHAFTKINFFAGCRLNKPIGWGISGIVFPSFKNGFHLAGTTLQSVKWS